MGLIYCCQETMQNLAANFHIFLNFILILVCCYINFYWVRGMFEQRSYCGELSLDEVGKRVSLVGWVDTKRDLGGIIFIEMRDVTGIVQVVFDASKNSAAYEKADKLKNEFCIHVTGEIARRTDDTINPNLKTGMIEVIAQDITILSESDVPPFPIDVYTNLNEEVRLKYRYLDLRRADMQQAIIVRHKVMQAIRCYLTDNRFFEVETPILNKSTPEGARDFLVPSRINRGMFYALPQSPQLFKQILMISGFDRYFQIAKCFRDEDLRNDRQPEFTQVDLEMSFVTPQIVMNIIEGLIKEIVKTVLNKEIATPFPVLTYDEVMQRYGKDAPDTRFGLELFDVTDVFTSSSFNVFKSAVENGGIIKAIVVNDEGNISRAMIDEYINYVRAFKAQGLLSVRYTGTAFETGIAKFLSDNEKQKLVEQLNLNSNALIIFSCDKPKIVNDALGNLRLKIAQQLNLIDDNKLNFLWVVDFPLLEYDAEEGRYYAMHHPFTAPKPECEPLLDTVTPQTTDTIKAQAYDIVLNGVEIGGGSIRINRMALQKKMFGILGISEEEAKVKFSFLLDALKYGAPPHGGIALGLDRILMILLKRNSIRDVIAFPKTQKGQCLMSEAPSPVSVEQLKELSIKVVEL